MLKFTNDYTEPRLHKVLYNEIANKQGAVYPVTCDREFYETIIALKDKLKFKLDNIDRRNIKAFGGVSKKVFDSNWRNHFRREFYELLEKNRLFGDVAKIIKRYPCSANYDKHNRAICDLFERNGILGDLTTIIQRSHPRKILEGFVAKVLRKIYPNDTVHENGSGRKSDFGADLIVGNSLVIQVKSYAGKAKDILCIDNIVAQLETAIKHYRANGVILITTGYSTPALEAALAKLENDMNMEIILTAGDDFARLVLRKTGVTLLF